MNEIYKTISDTHTHKHTHTHKYYRDKKMTKDTETLRNS